MIRSGSNHAYLLFRELLCLNVQLILPRFSVTQEEDLRTELSATLESSAIPINTAEFAASTYRDCFGTRFCQGSELALVSL